MLFGKINGFVFHLNMFSRRNTNEIERKLPVKNDNEISARNENTLIEPEISSILKLLKTITPPLHLLEVAENTVHQSAHDLQFGYWRHKFRIVDSNQRYCYGAVEYRPSLKRVLRKSFIAEDTSDRLSNLRSRRSFVI